MHCASSACLALRISRMLLIEQFQVSMIRGKRITVGGVRQMQRPRIPAPLHADGTELSVIVRTWFEAFQCSIVVYFSVTGNCTAEPVSQ